MFNISIDDVMEISANMALTLEKGRIILVRSTHDYEKYGDHFSLIVGGFIQKDRGLRPNLVTLPKIEKNSILDHFQKGKDITILLVGTRKGREVLDYYGIHLSEGDLVK